PAPAVNKDPVFEPLVTRSYYERVVLAACVWVRFAPMEHQRLGLEFYQFRADVLCPMPTPAALSQADIVEEHRKLRVENDAIFFLGFPVGRLRSLRYCLGFSGIDIRRKSCQSSGQIFD